MKLNIALWIGCLWLFGFGITVTPEKPKAYVFLAEECPISIFMAEALKENAEMFGDRVDLVAVFPNTRSNYKTMGLFMEEHGLESYRRILDEDQSLSKKLGASITPELIVVDQDEQVLFKGRISNAFYKVGRRKSGDVQNTMAIALESILDEGKHSKPWPRAVGCFITYRKN